MRSGSGLGGFGGIGSELKNWIEGGLKLPHRSWLKWCSRSHVCIYIYIYTCMSVCIYVCLHR